MDSMQVKKDASTETTQSERDTDGKGLRTTPQEHVIMLGMLYGMSAKTLSKKLLEWVGRDGQS